jgi:hypothetical protein
MDGDSYPIHRLFSWIYATTRHTLTLTAKPPSPTVLLDLRMCISISELK